MASVSASTSISSSRKPWTFEQRQARVGLRFVRQTWLRQGDANVAGEYHLLHHGTESPEYRVFVRTSEWSKQLVESGREADRFPGEWSWWGFLINRTIELGLVRFLDIWGRVSWPNMQRGLNWKLTPYTSAQRFSGKIGSQRQNGTVEKRGDLWYLTAPSTSGMYPYLRRPVFSDSSVAAARQIAADIVAEMRERR